MTEQADTAHRAKPKLTRAGIGVAIGTALGPISMGGVLFLSAGTLALPRAWFFVLLSFVGFLIHVSLVAGADPDLINRRGHWKKRKDTNRWDRRLILAYGLLTFTLTPVVSGADVGRFGLWPLGTWSLVTGAVMFVLGTAAFTWAMLVNTHFEVTVRIQHDRNHQVITAGPYAFVRHPGYVGACLWALSEPLIIGSVLGLIPASSAVVAVAVRSRREETLLRRELSGYSDYAARVRYRFIPGLW